MSSLDVLLAAAHVKNFPAPTEATHGAMGDPMFGLFTISDGGPHSNAFRKAYVHALRDEGRPMSIVEAHTDTSPVIVDLDMRQTTPERIYTQKHIENFMDALVAATKYFVDQNHMDVVILEKPTPRLDKKHAGMYKDGLHVFMPNVITHPEIQLAIREHFVNDVTEHMAFASTICIPGLAEMDPGKIYDESVIKRGGRWFLYGSKKPDEAYPWKVTAWYQFDIAAGSFAKPAHRALSSTGALQHLRHPAGLYDRVEVRYAESANPLAEWLEEVVEVTGASSDAVWIGDLKSRWKESHYGETSSVFSTKLVKAFFAGKQGTDWKETARMETKKSGAGRRGYYIFEEDTCQWVNVDEGRVKSVAVEAMEAALRDIDAWISTSMMVADLDLKRREILRLIRYTRSHRGVTNVMAFAGLMLRDETFEQGLNIIMVGGGNDTDDDDDSLSSSSINEDVLAEKFMEATPEFFSRIKFVPDFKKEECVGDMYYCNPATNRWSNCSNIKIRKIIATELKSTFPSEKNNKKLRWFVDTVRERKTFLQSVASLVLDETFADNLDINLDLFAVNNGVFDSSSRDTVVFRKVEMTDNISRCAKWDYLGEDNHHLQRCKQDLYDFLRKVIPVDEERDVVLAYFAGLLSGRRKDKKFLVFTDKTSGDNGKSTVLALFGSFFDEYVSFDGTKFMTNGSSARRRDDHDAGLKSMKSVRLLVSEKMKPGISLDEAFIKRIAGGEGVRIDGRSCGTGNSSYFMWQAGVVLVFNEGDCPKFGGGDSAFVKRMVVVPMRSNFVLHPEREHEFERRDNLADILPTWRSTLAQLLMEHFRRPGRSSIFDNLPVSMTEWKSGIADSANPLTEWLEDVVDVTGASSDAVWIGDLKCRWKESHYGHDTASVFSTKFVKAFFAGKQGTEWKETSQVVISMEDEKKKVVKRRVIRGIKLVGSI
eukprot:gene9332-biopygen9237